MGIDDTLFRLQDLSRRILNEAESLQRNSTKLDDHFTFMAMHYLFKQIEHLKALLLLAHHRDSILIIRAMLEGWAQLRWVEQEPSRAETWRAYAGVHDFYLARRMKERGETIPCDDEQWLNQWIENHSSQFLTRKARKKLETDPQKSIWDISTPFRNSWCPHDLRNLMKAIDHEFFYKQYQRMSGWQHWSCISLDSALVVGEEERFYNPNLSSDDHVWNLVLGSLCLVQTAILNSHYTEREQEKGALTVLQDEWLRLRPDSSSV